ncbi:MAG: hypothetical protein JSR46_02475, partial [Verrucomicrobia bacterium]|nr:hypothetical protein [Verrucomicrobiota bacterium]
MYSVMELVVVSTNTHKVAAFREILAQLLPHIQVLSLFDFPHYQPSSDEGEFVERAKTRAIEAAKALNKRCLVEQWRLCIPSLGEDQKLL